MVKQYNEKGYALLIVLFAIVFITIITAVFMRGALSNAKQEKIVDNNNLAVVAAESGVDYYTFELKKAFVEKDLDDIVENEINKANAKKVKPDYENIQNLLVENVVENLEDNEKRFDNKSFEMTSDFRHIIKRDNAEQHGYNIFKSEDYKIIQVRRQVYGEQLSNTTNKKTLTFDLIFKIPPVIALDEDDGDKNFDGIFPDKICKKTDEIEEENCLFPKNKTSDLKSIDESKVYIDEVYSGWRDVEIEDSFLYIKSFATGAKWDVDESEILVTGNLSKYGNTEFSDSTVHVEGDFSESGKIDFDESHITINGNFSVSSGENEIEESVMWVGKDFIIPNKAQINDSHLTIIGKTIFNTGGGFEESFVKMMSDFYSPSFLKMTDSELFVGGGLKLDSGALIDKTKLIVSSDVYATTSFNIIESQLLLGGNLNVTDPFKIEKSKMKINGKIKSDNGPTLDKAIVIIKDTDLGTLKVEEESTYCTENLKVRDRPIIDDNSKVYYLNSTNHIIKNKIEKLSKSDYDKKCSYFLELNDPDIPKKPGQYGSSQAGYEMINWEKYQPKIDEVDYNS